MAGDATLQAHSGSNSSVDRRASRAKPIEESKTKEPVVKLAPKGSMMPAAPGGVYMPPWKMKAVLAELEKADAEMKTAHCNRMVRYIK